MKIGVYGDSFTTSHIPARHFAWYNLLAQKLGGRVYNAEDDFYDYSYGLGGSSTFYSYKYFLKYHMQHDLNIFVASDVLKYTKLVDIFDSGPSAISGLNSLEYYINNPKTLPTSIDLCEKIKSWFLVTDEEFMWTAQELILRDIESKGNVIILAADLNTAFTKDRREKSVVKFGLWDFAHVMYDSLGIHKLKTGITLTEKEDKIAAHYTEEANHALADILYDHIKNGIRMKLPAAIPHRHDVNYYFGN